MVGCCQRLGFYCVLYPLIIIRRFQLIDSITIHAVEVQGIRSRYSHLIKAQSEAGLVWLGVGIFGKLNVIFFQHLHVKKVRFFHSIYANTRAKSRDFHPRPAE